MKKKGKGKGKWVKDGKREFKNLGVLMKSDVHDK